jgi:hypothetical protein
MQSTLFPRWILSEFQVVLDLLCCAPTLRSLAPKLSLKGGNLVRIPLTLIMHQQCRLSKDLLQQLNDLAHVLVKVSDGHVCKQM